MAVWSTPGESVRRSRGHEGLTLAQLAKRAGVSRAQLSAIESEEQALDLESARRLAAALAVHLLA